ncbi:hypothetical protein HOLleu_30890 [Holothuria leucospilota]|uniref:Uncharacterized protein n=1 Tax=Holothuria leucospilota TaxID=206669 RepID=A0A9Q1BL37_HOLLE|nr:hypothetical protein HOLleu_30890 [Holothuria leucospilota]
MIDKIGLLMIDKKCLLMIDKIGLLMIDKIGLLMIDKIGLLMIDKRDQREISPGEKVIVKCGLRKKNEKKEEGKRERGINEIIDNGRKEKEPSEKVKGRVCPDMDDRWGHASFAKDGRKCGRMKMWKDEVEGMKHKKGEFLLNRVPRKQYIMACKSISRKRQGFTVHCLCRDDKMQAGSCDDLPGCSKLER